MTDVNALLAPFSQEAEESVVGSVLISAETYQTLSAFLKSEDFFLTRHKHIWTAFDRLAARHDIMDLTTVSEELRQMTLLDEIGGYAYLIHLINTTPNSMHAETYGRLVERTSTRRLLLVYSDLVRSRAMDEKTNVVEVLRQSQKDLVKIDSRHTPQNGAFLEALIEDHAKDFERRLTLPDDAPESLLSTGFQDLDALMGELESDRLYVLAGRPGMGKTAKILNMMYRMAKRGTTVVLHTMEMSQKQIIDRLLAIDSQVTSSAQKHAKSLTPRQLSAIYASYGRLSELPIYIEDSPRPRPSEILSKSEWLVRQYNAKAVFVDGIYLMRPDYDTKGDMTAATGQIATDLKMVARTLGVPIIATHQLNRELEKRADKRPLLGDLRQSGEVEQSADTVLFVYRDWVYDPKQDPQRLEVIVAKNRDGATGTVIEGFDSITTYVYDADVQHVTLGGN